MNTTAVVGIVVAGVVGPSVAAWWTSHQQKQRLKHDRESSDLAELRQVLDDAAAAANRAMMGFHRVFAAVAVVMLTGQGTREQVEALASGYSDAILDAKAAGQRVQMRLGAKHSIATALGDFNVALLKASASVNKGYSVQGIQQGHAAMKDADVAAARFVDEANRLIESRLPK